MTSAASGADRLRPPGICGAPSLVVDAGTIQSLGDKLQSIGNELKGTDATTITIGAGGNGTVPVGNQPSPTLSATAQTELLLLEAAKLLGSTRTFEPKHAVQATIAFMQSHLGETISIEEVADAVHCSRAKLFEVFKDSTGMTPNDYWQRLRIDRAQRLLSNSETSITEIALDCGFSTSQYFSSVFRKYAGVSPTHYRKAEATKGTPEKMPVRRPLGLAGSRSIGQR